MRQKFASKIKIGLPREGQLTMILVLACAFFGLTALAYVIWDSVSASADLIEKSQSPVSKGE